MNSKLSVPLIPLQRMSNFFGKGIDIYYLPRLWQRIIFHTPFEVFRTQYRTQCRAQHICSTFLWLYDNWNTFGVINSIFVCLTLFGKKLDCGVHSKAWFESGAAKRSYNLLLHSHCLSYTEAYQLTWKPLEMCTRLVMTSSFNSQPFIICIHITWIPAKFFILKGKAYNWSRKEANSTGWIKYCSMHHKNYWL